MAIHKVFEIECDLENCGAAIRLRTKAESEALEHARKEGWRFIKEHAICPSCVARVASKTQQEEGTSV